MVWILSRVAPKPFAAGFLALTVGLPFLLYSTATYAPPKEMDLAQISGTVEKVTTSCAGRGGCRRTGVVLDVEGRRFQLDSGFCYVARDVLAEGDHVSAKYMKVGFKESAGTAFAMASGAETLCQFADAVAARRRLKDGGVVFGAIAVLFGLIAIAWSFFLGAKLGYANRASGHKFTQPMAEPATQLSASAASYPHPKDDY